jgi:Fic family protein
MIFQTPPPNFEEQAALARIEELRRELRLYVSEPRRWVGQIRRVLSARAIQGSNSIEGYDVSDDDAIAVLDGDEPSTATEESWHAVQGYRRAMTYVLQLAHDDHFAYTPQLLRGLHFMIAEHSLGASPGLWRPGPIWVRDDATAEIVYEAPEPEEVPQLIDELLAQLAAAEDVPVHVKGAIAHLNLVMIHPFRDGNGRMARCLQTLVLARDRVLEAPFSSIEEYLGRNTQSYYAVLAQVGGGRWSPANDIQAASVLRRVRESEQIWSRLDRLRERHRLPERTITALFDAGIGLRIRNSSYRLGLHSSWDEQISHHVAGSDLRAMVRAGLLRQLGAKRGTHYEAADPVREIVADVRRGRTPIDASSLFLAR